MQATVHGVAKSWARLGDFTSLHFFTKHLLCSVAITFTVRGLKAKLTQISFLFFTFTTGLSNVSIQFFVCLFVCFLFLFQIENFDLFT